MIENRNLDPSESRHSHPGTRDELHIALLELIRKTQNEFTFAGPMLEPAIWCRSDTTEALGQMVTRHSRNRVRIAIEDSEYFLNSCTRLVELARRVSDILMVRRIGDIHHGFNQAIVIGDRAHCLVQKDASRYDATLDLDAPRIALLHLERFDEIWQTSDPLPGLHGFRL